MGITMQINNTHATLVYAQPSGLTSTWTLKYTVTVQSPPAQACKHISNIMVSAVLNVHPFLQLWLACMLRITLWAQLARFSAYPLSCHFARDALSSGPHYKQNNLGCRHHSSVVLSHRTQRASLTGYHFFPSASLDEDVCYVELRRICIPAPATRRSVQHHLYQLVLGFPNLVWPLPPTGPCNIPHTWALCLGGGGFLVSCCMRT